MHLQPHFYIFSFSPENSRSFSNSTVQRRALCVGVQLSRDALWRASSSCVGVCKMLTECLNGVKSWETTVSHHALSLQSAVCIWTKKQQNTADAALLYLSKRQNSSIYLKTLPVIHQPAVWVSHWASEVNSEQWLKCTTSDLTISFMYIQLIVD